jgi:uncharacterized protein (DUF58 family)
MHSTNRVAEWLENRAVAPAYSGWVLAAVALCFFGAAINTMGGWLYVLSGISFALLGMAAVLSARALLGLDVRRHLIQPVSAGDQLIVKLELENQTTQPKTLLQVQDLLPFVLGQSVQAPIEIIPPHQSYQWIYYYPTQRRGVYRWQTVQLRTATPLGLFWCRRRCDVPATAIVYPTVLPLSSCPLVDEMRQKDTAQFYNLHTQRFQTATEGLTRSLRPYRLGDPTRLIHWRTSARYGELRVRELEVMTGGQEIVICLDSAGTWQPHDFEQAVIAAASLYFYAHQQHLNVKLWTSGTGLVQGERVVLEALAATEAGEELSASAPLKYPLIWLSQNPLSLSTLPSGSRWVMWLSSVSSPQPEILVNRDYPGLVIQAEQQLQLQLQKSLR